MKNRILYSGSVKDILTMEGEENRLLFHFSDRYSIFDWGEMPDQLPQKGAALASIGHAFFTVLANPLSWKHWLLPESINDSYNVISLFEYFKKNGVPHHMIGFSDEMGNDLPKGQVADFLKVEKMAVVKPEFENGRYDYSAYKRPFTQTVVPLEIIFRFGAPAGASVIKRSKDEKYLAEVGLEGPVEAGEWFDKPVIEFFTKLESSDRYVTYEQARTMAGLAANEFARLINFTTLIAYRLRDYLRAAGLTLWDGKIEVAFDEMGENGRHFKLVDSIGPDELRLDFEEVPLSKEVLRSFYRDDDWHQALEGAQTLAKNKGLKDWKSLLNAETKPRSLSPEELEVASALYPTLAQAITHALNMNEDYRADSELTLEELAAKIKEVMK